MAKAFNLHSDLFPEPRAYLEMLFSKDISKNSITAMAVSGWCSSPLTKCLKLCLGQNGQSQSKHQLNGMEFPLGYSSFFKESFVIHFSFDLQGLGFNYKSDSLVIEKKDVVFE